MAEPGIGFYLTDCHHFTGNTNRVGFLSPGSEKANFG